jgi:hypothetical protein
MPDRSVSTPVYLSPRLDHCYRGDRYAMFSAQALTGALLGLETDRGQ